MEGLCEGEVTFSTGTQRLLSHLQAFDIFVTRPDCAEQRCSRGVLAAIMRQGDFSVKDYGDLSLLCVTCSALATSVLNKSALAGEEVAFVLT